MIGLLHKPWTHDLRRGAASDLTNSVKKNLPGTKSSNTRVGLGHTLSALGRGVTEAYQGRQRADNWTPRVVVDDTGLPNEEFKDYFGLEMALEPQQKRLRLSAGEVTEKCKEMGLDAAGKKYRERAGRKLHAERHTLWANGATALLNEPVEQHIDEWRPPKGPAKFSGNIEGDDCRPASLPSLLTPSKDDLTTPYQTPIPLLHSHDDDWTLFKSFPDRYNPEFQQQTGPYYLDTPSLLLMAPCFCIA